MIREILFGLTATAAAALVVAPPVLAEVMPGAQALGGDSLESPTAWTAQPEPIVETEVVTPVTAEPKQVEDNDAPVEAPVTEWDASEWAVVEESETLTVNPTPSLSTVESEVAPVATDVEPTPAVVEETESEVAAVEPTPAAVEETVVQEPVEETAPMVAQVTPLQPVYAPEFFGTDGESTGAQVSASVYVEPGTVVDRQQAGFSHDGLTVDVFRQGVNVTEDSGQYSSEEYGTSASVEVHRDENLAVRVHAYGGTINESWTDDDWTGDGHTTYVGAAVDAEVSINGDGGVVTGSIGMKNSRGQTIGGEDFNRTSPTVNLAVDTPISVDGRTRLYTGGGYDETLYADFSVNYDVLSAENQSLAFGAFTSYRDNEVQVGPEIAYTVGDQDQSGLYARVAARLNALDFTPQLAAEVVWNF